MTLSPQWFKWCSHRARRHRWGFGKARRLAHSISALRIEEPILDLHPQVIDRDSSRVRGRRPGCALNWARYALPG